MKNRRSAMAARLPAPLAALFGGLLLVLGATERARGGSPQYPGDHDRRPGLWRPRRARQSQDQDAKPRRVRRRERPAQEFLRFARLLADSRQSLDRPVQLPHGRGRYLSGPVADAPRRGHAGRDAGCQRLSDRDLRQVAPGRQRAAAADRPGLSGGAGDQGGRHRPAVRSSRRQQLLRSDLAAQRQARTLEGLLQRHLHPGRDRLLHRAGRPAVLCLPGIQLPARAARSSAERAGRISEDEPVALGVSPARQADPTGVRAFGRLGRAGLCDDHQHRHQRRQGPEGPRGSRACPTTRSSSS